jgi:hypothetical protein
MGLGFGFTKLMRESIDRNRSMLSNTIDSKNRLKYKGSDIKYKKAISSKKASPSLLKSIREKAQRDNLKSNLMLIGSMILAAIVVSYYFWNLFTSPM